jgi:hypothetical protein
MKKIFLLLSAILLVLVTFVGLVCAQTYPETRAASTSARLAKLIKTLVNRGTLISKLPIASTSLSLKNRSSASIAETSGTPPLLVEIKNQPLKNLFWMNNIIDDLNTGTPSQNTCNQYRGVSVNGESAGNGACYMAQDLAYSFESVLSGDKTFCFLQKMITAADGITVTGANSVEEALAPNSGTSAKLVKVETSGMPSGTNPSIFFIIPGKGTNNTNGNLYEHSLFFCEGNSNPAGHELGTIKKNLSYIVSKVEAKSGETLHSSITSKLELVNNRIVFNPDREKEITMERTSPNFCSSREVSMTFKNGKIRQRAHQMCGGRERVSYSILKYTGQSIKTLRFKEGAQKDLYRTISTEYRDDRYVSAPYNTEFNYDLSQVDLNTDPFYSQFPTIDTSILSSFNCNRIDQDVTISMDFSNSNLSNHTAVCQNRGLNGMEFCRADAEVNSAETVFYGQCAP